MSEPVGLIDEAEAALTKKSFGRALLDNFTDKRTRMLWLVVLFVAVIAGAVVMGMASGREDGMGPAIGALPPVEAIPGGEQQAGNERYQDLLARNDEEGYRQAEAAGGSFLSSMPVLDAADKPVAPRMTLPEPKPLQPARQQQEEPVVDDRLVELMVSQMTELGEDSLTPAAMVATGWEPPSVNEERPAAEEAKGEPAAGEVILARLGDTAYVEILTTVRSVDTAPVEARILSGPLRDARLIGEYTKARDRMVVRFSRMSLPKDLIVRHGVPEVTIDAMLVDPHTGRVGMAHEVDHMWFERYVIDTAATFLAGVADAISRPETVTVTDFGATQAYGDTSTAEKVWAGVGEVARKVSEDVEKAADTSDAPIVTLKANRGAGVIFLKSVTL